MSLSPIELIDTHVHLDDDRYDKDRDRVVASAHASGVKTMVVPATTRNRWTKIQSLANSYTGVIPAYGLHPLFMQEQSESDLFALEKQIKHSPCIAIGECGLDRHCLKQLNKSDDDPAANAATDPALSTADLFARQLFYFEAQINLAAKLNLPVIVHARQAIEDVILSIKKCPATRGVVHSFNGSIQQATRLIDLGYRLSFGGAVTYPRATKLHKLIQVLPCESLLIETDAPHQTGNANQGQRNEPAYLHEVLQTVAKLRGESAESVACQCNLNAAELLNLEAWTKEPSERGEARQ